MDGNDPAAGHWRYPAGESHAGAGDDGGSFAVHMFRGTIWPGRVYICRWKHGTRDDPLEPVWRNGGGGATWPPEASSCLLPSPAIAERGLPPSEDVMAAWLYPIVSGQDRAADDRQKAPTITKQQPAMMTESSKGKFPATDVMFGATKDTNSSEKEKASGGSSSRKGSATHNLTEKRRRGRIAERFRTLQQLVPGCDNKAFLQSSQASTLDQTIQYMRSLQQQLQSMSTSWQAPAASATAAVYPVTQTPPAASVVMPMPTAAATFRFRPGVVPMVPLRAMFPYPYYHALTMPAAAPAAPPPRPPPRATGHHAPR